MKKSIVALLVLLALVVIVSPAILGRFAEKSVDENLNWAAAETGDFVVTSEKFDRGWFSSHGQHRVRVGEGNLKAMLRGFGETDDDIPVLVIDTHLDHGLIPVSSMSREKGSLAPGLGSAVSTLSVEFSDGETIELPGTIYSKVGLDGALHSNYVLEPGSHSDGDARASWGSSNIDVTTNPTSGDVSFNGNIAGISIADPLQSVAVGKLEFSGSQKPTRYGFSIGDMTLDLDTLSIKSNGVPAGGLKSMRMDGKTTLSKGRVSGQTTLNMASEAIPQFGEVSLAADIRLEGADAESLGALQRALKAQSNNPVPDRLFAATERDLKRLLAAGLAIRFEQFDVSLPMGTVKAKFDASVAESDTTSFEWTSLLLGTEASADFSVPETLIEMAVQMNPGVAIGMGFLQKNGDVYDLKAEYKKGLLTINGAPMPIPFGAL